MTAHTPGPWEQVGHLVRTEFHGEGGWLVAECERSLPEHDANARLIAAAPELLAKVQELAEACAECNGTGLQYVPASLCSIPGDSNPCPDCADIRAVITKAVQP